MFFPKGVSARPAILKCCKPKGIPIIVIHNNSPNIKCVRLIHIPPINIQTIFIKTDKQPPDPLFSVTLLPKGHNDNMANLSVYNPNGIPIMVTISIILANKYSRAIIIPPKISQIMFPNRFMVL
jgi:hypothetical protein